MQTKLQKWGNSLAVRIPARMATELAVDSGDAVELAVVDGSIVVTPAGPRIPTLDELLDSYDPATRHEEFDWGPPVGKEAW